MPEPIQILTAFFAAAAAVAAIVVGFVVATKIRLALASAAVVLAVALGFAVGAAWLGVRPTWPPREDQHRLLVWILPAATILEALLASRRGWTPAIARFVAGFALAPAVLFGSVYLDRSGIGPWSPGMMAGILAMLGAGAGVVWSATARLAERSPGASLPIALASVAAGAGAAIMLSGYASGGQLAIALAGCLAGLVVCWFLKSESTLVGGVGLSMALLASLIFAGRFFGSLTTTHAALLLAAPLAAWLVEGTPRSFRAALRVVIVILPISLAVHQAREQFLIRSQTPANPYLAE